MRRIWDVCFSAWLDMGFCERREGGLGSVAGCGCDYCMMVVERSYSVQNFCTNPGPFSMVCYKEIRHIASVFIKEILKPNPTHPFPFIPQSPTRPSCRGQKHPSTPPISAPTPSRTARGSHPCSSRPASPHSAAPP